MIGQIRLEDSFYEAKILQPIPPNCVRYKRYPEMEKNDKLAKSEDLLPVQGVGTEFREG
jgi:hypothetical protein